MPTWSWNEVNDEEGFVHQSVANTDNDNAAIGKQGYDYSGFDEITPDPDVYWPCHEDSGSTMNDVAGTNDGNISGATVGQEGLLNATAHSYDGVDDETRAGTVGLANTHTIVFWVYPRSFTNDGNPRMLDSAPSDNDGLRIFFTDDGSVRYDLIDGSTDNTLTTSQTLSTNSWQQLAVRADAGDMNVLINGSLDSNTLTGASINDINDMQVGNKRTGGDYADMKIAEIAIFNNTALSDAQVQTLYDVVRAQGQWLSTGKLL